MRAPSAFVVVAIGLLLLWLAVAGRLEAVWTALTAATSGPASGGGSVGGGRDVVGPKGGGGGGRGLLVPVPSVRLPDYMEFIVPGRDRYLPDGAPGYYRTVKGADWTTVYAPVKP